ncbi:MAG: hypothetical protein Kow0013_28920 [Pararhodobacter sp.]
MAAHGIGIDIFRSHLEVFRLEAQTAKRFENSANGFRAPIKWVSPLAVTRVSCIACCAPGWACEAVPEYQAVVV